MKTKQIVRALALIALFYVAYLIWQPLFPLVCCVVGCYSARFFVSDKWSKKCKRVVAGVMIAVVAILLCIVDRSKQFYLLAFPIFTVITTFVFRWENRRRLKHQIGTRPQA